MMRNTRKSLEKNIYGRFRRKNSNKFEMSNIVQKNGIEWKEKNFLRKQKTKAVEKKTCKNSLREKKIKLQKT